jgi:hypothetical protein
MMLRGGTGKKCHFGFEKEKKKDWIELRRGAA